MRPGCSSSALRSSSADSSHKPTLASARANSLCEVARLNIESLALSMRARSCVALASATAETRRARSKALPTPIQSLAPRCNRKCPVTVPLAGALCNWFCSQSRVAAALRVETVLKPPLLCRITPLHNCERSAIQRPPTREATKSKTASPRPTPSFHSMPARSSSACVASVGAGKRWPGMAKPPPGARASHKSCVPLESGTLAARAIETANCWRTKAPAGETAICRICVCT